MFEIAFDPKGSTEHGFGYCTLCGQHGIFLSYEPIDTVCKRGGFICQNCESVARNRHVAMIVMQAFRDQVDCTCLREFAEKFPGRIWVGCVKEPVSRVLGSNPRVVRSDYFDGVPSGQLHNGFLCQNIQETSFDDNEFDLVITEEVLEHVPDPAKAFGEIRRVLKPGGKHVFTIPVVWSEPHSYLRAVLEDGVVRHIHPPEYHGDPFRADGVLAFSTFGMDVVEKYCSLTGPTRIYASNGNRLHEQGFQIRNNWVFVSEKV